MRLVDPTGAAPVRPRGRRVRHVVLAAVALGVGGWTLAKYGRSLGDKAAQRVTRRRTVADVLRDHGPAALARLLPRFAAADVPYPPRRVTLLALKHESTVELWARTTPDAEPRFVHSYPIRAASGGPGPKLREGDRQVPEGRYRITGLNPNSSYHLSMRLDYPNADDERRARADGRTGLGGDIFIHGKDVSIGCIALGDEAIEELFVLVAATGAPAVEVLIAPNDLRVAAPDPKGVAHAPWAAALYAELTAALEPYRTRAPGEP